MRKWAAAAYAVAMLALPGIASAHPGDFDPRFSGDGIAALAEGSGGGGLIAPQSTGKVVVAPAHRLQGSNSLMVTRLTTNGIRDETFGSTGTVSLGCEAAADIVAAPDDSIFVASSDCLVKLTPNGQLDEAFGDDGVVQLLGGSDVALDETGRVLVAGVHANGKAYVRRLEPDGDPDLSFSSDGETDLEHFSATFYPLALSTSSNDVFVGGTVEEPAVTKLDASGEIDAAFGSGGTATYNAPGFEPSVNDLQLAPDGDVLIAGSQGSTETTFGFIAKFDPEGILAATFAQTGAYTSGGPLFSLVIRSNGSIIAGGASHSNCPGRAGPNCIVQSDAILIQLTGSGSRDNSFGTQGLVAFDLDGLDSIAEVALDANEQTLLVGGDAEFRCCDNPPKTFVSRHLLSGATQDRDADGRADADDPCPLRFSLAAQGCPSFSRVIEIDAVESTDEGLSVFGNTASPAEPCWFASDPRLQRKAPDGWRLERFDDVYEGIPGLFKFTIDHSTHRHRLILNRDRVEGEGICKPARPVLLPR